MIKTNLETAMRLMAGYRQCDCVKQKLQQEGSEVLLVIRSDDDYPFDGYVTYYATKTFQGQLVTDENGMVSFKRVKPIIDENTCWQFTEKD